MSRVALVCLIVTHKNSQFVSINTKEVLWGSQKTEQHSLKGMSASMFLATVTTQSTVLYMTDNTYSTIINTRGPSYSFLLELSSF